MTGGARTMLLVTSAIAAAVAIGIARRESAPSRSAVDALVAATNEASLRRITARLNGSFDFRPLKTIHTPEYPDSDDLPLLTAAARVNREAAENPTRNNLHALGVAHLLLRDPSAALRSLEGALRIETKEEQVSRGIARSTDSALLADLSAVYYESAMSSRRASGLLPAIACAERAAQLDSQSQHALWNRAIALDALGAREDALASWDAYLRLDSDSGWAGEARQRKARLEGTRDEELWPTAATELRHAAERDDAPKMRELVRRFPTRSVALVEKQLLPAWGRMVLASDSGSATSALRTASRIAVAIAAVTNDSLLSDVTRDASNAVAEVYAAYGDLGNVFREGGTVAVTKELTRLRGRLVQLRSPAAIRFTLALARSRYEARDHEAALRELRALENGSLLQRYPLSLAQLQWFRGLALASLGYATQAIESYGTAMDLYRRVGDSGAAGSLALMRADAAEHAGDTEQAWDSYASAMRDVDLHGETMMRDQLTFAVARSALRRGYPDPALILFSRLVDRVRPSGRKDVLCQALIGRCETNARLGRGDAARTDCAAARKAFDAISDDATRDRLQADLDLATAVAKTSQTSSIAPLTSALNVSIRGNDHFRLARIYLARARAYLAQRNDTAAERDLRSAIDEIEGQREKLASDDFRIAWLDSWRTIHEELVLLLIRQRRFDDAFEAADSSRARIFLDRNAAGSPRATIADVRRRLTGGTVFVELWNSTDGDGVAWIVRRDGTACRRFAMRGAARRIHECLRHFERPNEQLSKDATPESLFDDIVRPWIADVRGAKTMILAPDTNLAAAPFAAMSDRSTNRSLLAAHALIIEPSAATLIAAARPAAPWTTALVVDSPATGPDLTLPKLATQAEMKALATTFRNLHVLRHSDATPTRFMDAAARSDVIHFGGHAIDDVSHDGALVMAPDDTHPDGLLSGQEIARSPSRRGGLVVLAACRTSRGRIGSDGAMSLARSFLVTGSTAVVGSLWNVDDETADDLFAAFYRELAAGRAVAEALRTAQLQIAAVKTEPRYWAAFHVYGGAG